MTKISKIIAAATSLAVLGIAALPMAGFAATTTTDVEVAVGAECLIGEGTGNTSGEALLNVSLTASAPVAIDSGAAGDSIDIVCNEAWTLAERATNALGTPTNELAEKTDDAQAGTFIYDGAVGFTALATPVTTSAPAVADLASFGVNEWGMAYTGTDVNTVGEAWHGPTTSNVTIAGGNATAKSSIVQFFGASTDGSVAPGTYGAVVTYTLAP